MAELSLEYRAERLRPGPEMMIRIGVQAPYGAD